MSEPEPVPVAAQEWWAACFPQWTQKKQDIADGSGEHPESAS